MCTAWAILFASYPEILKMSWKLNHYIWHCYKYVLVITYIYHQINQLVCIGGTSAINMVSRCVDGLMTTDLQSRCSRYGRKGNKIKLVDNIEPLVKGWTISFWMYFIVVTKLEAKNWNLVVFLMLCKELDSL